MLVVAIHGPSEKILCSTSIRSNVESAAEGLLLDTLVSSVDVLLDFVHMCGWTAASRMTSPSPPSRECSAEETMLSRY